MTEVRFRCPLCERAVETRDALHRHLLVGHRKHAIATAIVDGSDRPAESVEPQ